LKCHVTFRRSCVTGGITLRAHARVGAGVPFSKTLGKKMFIYLVFFSLTLAVEKVSLAIVR
jgi:hypothetical protein